MTLITPKWLEMKLQVYIAFRNVKHGKRISPTQALHELFAIAFKMDLGEVLAEGNYRVGRTVPEVLSPEDVRLYLEELPDLFKDVEF